MAGVESSLSHLPCLHSIAPHVGATATASQVSSLLFLYLVDLFVGWLVGWLLIPVASGEDPSEVKWTAISEMKGLLIACTL
jgi:hypothetical protein